MSATSPSLATQWIVGPRYDLAFFSTVWLPPLLVVGLDGFSGWEVGAGFFVLWIYHLFIRLPHFAAMFRVTYLRPTQLPHYREHWVRYFAIPIAIMGVYAAPLATTAGYESTTGFVLTTVGYLWGYQHIGMQNYGILQIYRLRGGSTGTTPRLERTIFYAIIVSVCVSNHLASVVRFASDSALSPGDAQAVSYAILGFAGILIAVYFAQLNRAGALRTPAVLYLTISAIAMVRWPFYDALPAGSWFLVFNGHHSVAYLGLLFLMTWNEKFPEKTFTFASGAKEYMKFFWPLVGASIGLILVAASYHSARVEAGYEAPGTGSLEALLGFFVAHYYVESNVWRFRHAFNRETTLSLLRRPGRSDAHRLGPSVGQ